MQDERKILLADDNPADVYLIRQALLEHGVTCPVLVAPNGKDVLQILSAAGVGALSLVILDLNLPLHDGFEILEQLRTMPSLAHVPVVVLTSSDSPRDRIVASGLGVACYLRKPSNLEQFLGLGAVFKNLLDSIRTIAQSK